MPDAWLIFISLLVVATGLIIGWWIAKPISDLEKEKKRNGRS